MDKLDKDIYVELGKSIKRARREKGVSLRELGNAVGKTYTTIMRYENAECRVDMVTLQSICSYLGIPIPDLSSTIDNYRSNDLKEQLFNKLVGADKHIQIAVLTLLGFDDAIELADSLPRYR